MSELIKSVKDADFTSEVLESKQLVLIDFWAEWCGPCRMITPVLEQVAEELGARLKIVKVNVDDNPQLAAQYGVRSIPNLVLMKSGAVIGNKVGALGKAQLISFINDHLTDA